MGSASGLVATASEQYTIVLPPQHPRQALVFDHPARFKVVVCGRRWGKTTGGLRRCLKGALEDPGVYWWVGPNFPSIQASGAWELLKTLVVAIPGVEIREADRVVRLPNRAEIWVKSAVDPDSLRGPKLKGVVLDEFATMKERAWTQVIRPALTDYQGWAIFIGTPKGKNWAYKLWRDAATRKDWAAFREPSKNNPYLPPGEIEAARQDMSDNEFKQEYEADFGASTYLVYEEFDPSIHVWRGPVPRFVGYRGGMDFGGDTIGAHKSATAIAGRTEWDALIIIAAFKQSGPNIAERQMNWTLEQHMRLEAIHKELKLPWNPPTYRADRSQMVGIQFMQQTGLHVFKTKGGPDSVDEGVQMVHRRLKVREDKRPRLYVLEGVPWVVEDFEHYRYPEPKDDGQVQSRNPLKVDDDLMDAVRYLVEGTDRGVAGDPEQYRNSIPGVA